MREWRREVLERLKDAGLDGFTERDVADELTQHLADRYDELLARGVPAEEAREKALAELGDVDALAARVRRTVPARPEHLAIGSGPRSDGLGGWWSDLRFAVRMLLRARAYTAIVVVVLAVGIGANTVIFTALNSVLLRPPSGVADADRLAVVYTSDYSGPRYGSSSYPDYEAIRDERIFEGVALHSPRSFGLSAAEWRQQAMGEVVSANYFDVLGVAPAAGRFFGPDEAGTEGTSSVVVIGHDLWQSRFGGAPEAVGSTLRLMGQPLTIIGVAPRSFGGWLGIRLQLWVPASAPAAITGFDPSHRGNRAFMVVGRMAEGVTTETVQSGLDVVASRLHAAFPQQWTDVNQRSRVFTVLPEAEARIPPQGRAPILGFAALLMGAVLMVLLVACTNVANLLLSRASARRAEMGIRIALGASRARIVRHLLAESLVLAALGGGAGVLLAVAFTGRLASVQLSLPIPVVLDIALDVRVLAFAAGITLVTGILFGLAPALQASRTPGPMLKDDARSGTRLGLRNALVVLQVASSLVLLVGGGLFLKSLYAAQRIETGFQVDDVVLARFTLDVEGYSEEQSAQFYEELLTRVGALRGTAAAALAETVPLSTGYSRRGTWVSDYEPAPGENMEMLYNGVTPGYFATLGVPLVLGRAFTEQDREGAQRVAIVSEAFARRYWPGENPLGKWVGFSGPDGPLMEVVGVAADARYRNLIEEHQPYVYFPHEQMRSPYMALLARATGEPERLASGVVDVVRDIAPSLSPPTVQTFRTHIAAALLPQRVAGVLLSILGAFAISIAVIGLYGLIAYCVAQRAHEFGVRMALGAVAVDVRRLVLGQSLRLVVIGILCGLPIAGTVAFLISGLLVVPPLDPVAFVGVPLLLAGCGLLAGYAPARRATRQDPAAALRAE